MSEQRYLEMTPLGAAVVEALPNRKRVKEIERAFKSKAECPASEIFTAREVTAYYKKQGQQIKGIPK